MITCARCKAANLDGGRYCDECGAPLDASSAPPPDIDPAARGLVKSEDGQNGSHSAADIAAPQGAPKRSGSLNVSPSRPAGKPHAKLVIERGKSVGKEFVLNSAEANIGRWDADGGIFPDVDLDSDDPEAKVSRRHARIIFSEGTYLLEDLGSTNGTFINRGKRIAPGTRQQINDGDEIIVGKTFLRFRVIK
jgi:pSer/pThr/pTyr-binding forkhead associated (FHA) protein